MIADSSDPDCHHIELESLRQREQDLIRQRSENETEFGQQRAKFMDLFRQKEGKLNFLGDDKYFTTDWMLFGQVNNQVLLGSSLVS